MGEINFNRLVSWHIPNWLRKNRTVLLALALIWPIKQLHSSLLSFMAAKLYRLSHNGQVCYLEKVLNDAFDPTLKRIWIGNFEGAERIYFWPEVDRRDVDFSTVQFFWADIDYADSGIDFTVHLPAFTQPRSLNIITTPSQLAYLKALTDEYKLAGKRYNIVRDI